MPLVDFDLVKRHLRVDWDDENTEIQTYQAAAEAMVSEYLDRPVLPTSIDESSIALNAPITAAILLLTADLFEHREPGGDGDHPILPAAIRKLLSPYRVWKTFEENTCPSAH